MAFPRYDRLDYQPYFRALADRLALKDWRIEVTDEEPSDSQANLSVQPVEGRKWARLRLSEFWLRRPPEAQRLGAVHELIHVHHATEINLLKKWLSADAFAAWLMAHEYAVDGLADAIAPLMPLPSEVLDAAPAPAP